MSAEPTYPRSVTPGIETHERVELDDGTIRESNKLPEPGIYVGLDWIRCTGPASFASRVSEMLCERFGSDRRPIHGAKWFKYGNLWEPGVLLSWGHKADICQVDIQGQRLRMMNGSERVDLLRALLHLGLSPTRLDGALDWIGQDVGLCVAATESCKRGELCILRSYRLNDAFTANGLPTRRHLNVGGRESSACARFYDKGLEQGIAPPGYWERLEVEWKDDRAPEVGRTLYQAKDGWANVLVSLILGAVDFRAVSGRTELARRPVAAWWMRLKEGREGWRIAPANPDESFERWLGWFRAACGPRLIQLALAANLPFGEVVGRLLTGTQSSTQRDQVLAGFMRALHNGAIPDT